MTFRKLSLALLALGAVAVANAVTFNGVKIMERAWNDSPSSVLTTANTFPSMIQFDESFSGSTGWANQHRWLLSTDGGSTAYGWVYGTPVDISMTIKLESNNAGLNSEAGFYADKYGDSKFFVRSDGLVEAFGGAFNNFSWGNAYTLGTEATMRVLYNGTDQVELFFNGVSSGVMTPGYGEKYWLPGMVFGGYAQNRVAADHHITTTFTNINAVPEPLTVIGLGLGLAGLIAKRRRRA